MTHPLTDEICDQVTDELGYYTIENAMRSAADWQLEQDAKFFAQYLINNFDHDPNVAELRAEWFKEAMRPQQQEDN